MKNRTTELLSAESIATAGTKTIAITTKDIISRISAIVELTNADWTPTGHPALTIKNIQIVDGSEVLFSMRGVYAQALAFYGTKHQAYNALTFTAGAKCKAEIPIYFGRYLWDRDWALDPKRYNNLQLKITHDLSLGGCTPTVGTLEVHADIFDEDQPSPVGFLRAESLWSKTLVASTKDEIDLPTDYDIRMLLPASRSLTEEPDVNIAEVRLTENMGKDILIDAQTVDILKLYEAEWPPILEYSEGRLAAAANVAWYVTPCKDIILSFQPREDLDCYINFPWSGGCARNIMGSAGSEVQGSILGRCPHGVFPLPLGEPDVSNTWWHIDPTGSRKCRLTTGAGDTSSYYELLMQQAKIY